MNLSPYKAKLQEFAAEGRFRVLPQGLREAYDLSSNDYMGLGTQQQLQEPQQHSFGSCASRLLASQQAVYKDLEDLLRRLYGREALLFNSGYHANTGIIPALAATKDCLIVADRLVHASIIDGIRLCGAPFVRFRHNDTAHLRSVLEKNREKYETFLVVTESIFSMDGDIAPLREIVALAKEFPIITYVDEAHAIGVRGRKGLGVAEELGLLQDIDILVGTFGKAAASIGAFAICAPVMRDYLINTARSFIFSTALPPANIAFSRQSLLRLSEMESEREWLKDISSRFREGLERLSDEKNPSRSQIVPLIVGDTGKALKFSELLEERGFHCLPIRKPTVPEGTERLRFSLNAAMSAERVEQLLLAVEEVWKEVMG